MSTVLAWSEHDQLAAITSLANEREACPGCGLRPDQHTSVAADLDRCPGCEARTRIQKSIDGDDPGLRTVFVTVDDTRDSVWAKYTSVGAHWAAKHRHDPNRLHVADPTNLDG